MLDEFLVTTYFGNAGQQYLTALIVFLITIVGTWIFKVYILHMLKKMAEKTENEYDDRLVEILRHIPKAFYILFGLYISTRTLELPFLISNLFYYTFVLVSVFYAVKVIQLLIDFFVEQMAALRGEKTTQSMLVLMGRIVKAVLWAIAFLIILANFGVEITPLIAGLGIGGLAIAFAFQNILSDLFSSFSIYFDKPFEIGDFIMVGQDMGVVKYIGLKTTRLTTLQGQELVISNSELTNTRIHNFKRMERRRIVFEIGVEYSTPTDKLRLILELVKDVFESIEIVDLDRVHFKEFADSSLNYEIVYFINSNDFLDYMNAQQEINLGILERFRKNSIEMAFPTTTVHLVQ